MAVPALLLAANYRVIDVNSEQVKKYFYRPQRSWGKVIFSEACVNNSVHGGGGACVVLFSGGGGVRGFFSFFRYNEIRSMSGQYASYWNAFLLNFFSHFSSPNSETLIVLGELFS